MTKILLPAALLAALASPALACPFKTSSTAVAPATLTTASVEPAYSVPAAPIYVHIDGRSGRPPRRASGFVFEAGVHPGFIRALIAYAKAYPVRTRESFAAIPPYPPRNFASRVKFRSRLFRRADS